MKHIIAFYSHNKRPKVWNTYLFPTKPTCFVVSVAMLTDLSLKAFRTHHGLTAL